ncbi:MAG: DNA repair protein RadA [Flavobacteriales bacterium]|nr:DNA repair protein RadA [Flavobacteriales bacterium]
MSKPKTTFFCQNCGASSPKWVGKCNSCGLWNTYVEEVVVKEKSSGGWDSGSSGKSGPGKYKPKTFNDIHSAGEQRLSTFDKELDRVLGGGMVNGSLMLLGGEPGIGKSTLLLQLAVKSSYKVLYLSGEESETQIKMRAERIGINNEDCFILSSTNIQAVFQILKELQPEVVIIDSIQTLHTNTIDSAPGSISQIRECASEFLRYSKESNTPVFLIGHITKDGMIAGPKVLEHMVDTVLQFEGDRHHTYRILRATKNRFGSASEIGIYEMISTGLREVSNPSEILITQREQPLSGISITAALEGMRPLLVETQALVSSAVYGTPQRNANGFDLKRLNMLLAVLEKRCGFFLGTQDVFVNIAGGLKLEDPGLDLGIAIAILSSFHNQIVNPSLTFAGEIGLSGEIRSVSKIEQRISESEKLGFKSIIISKFNQKGLPKSKIEIIPVAKVEECLDFIWI